MKIDLDYVVLTILVAAEAVWTLFMFRVIPVYRTFFYGNTGLLLAGLFWLQAQAQSLPYSIAIGITTFGFCGVWTMWVYRDRFKCKPKEKVVPIVFIDEGRSRAL